MSKNAKYQQHNRECDIIQHFNNTMVKLFNKQFKIKEHTL